MSFCLWVDLSKSCFSQVRYNLNRSKLLRRDGSTFSNILSLHLDASIPHAFGQFAAQNISACVIDAQHDFQSVVRDTFAVLRQITCCVETIIYHDYCALFSPSFTSPEVGVGGTWTMIQTWKENHWFPAEVIRKSLRLCKALWMLDFWHIVTWLSFFFFFFTIHFFHGFRFGGPKPLGGNFCFFNNSFSTTFVWVSNYSHHRFVGQPVCWVCPPQDGLSAHPTGMSSGAVRDGLKGQPWEFYATKLDFTEGWKHFISVVAEKIMFGYKKFSPWLRSLLLEFCVFFFWGERILVYHLFMKSIGSFWYSRFISLLFIHLFLYRSVYGKQF